MGRGWYGTASMTTVACSLPVGYATSSTDCNDAATGVNPGATEVCANGVDDNCAGGIDELPECSIPCNWSGARWLSHGWDGPAYTGTGAWFSCSGGELTYVQYVASSGTGRTASPAGTSDLLVGCNWSGDRWASQGLDGASAFTNGARVSCSSGRVTGLTWESNTVTPMAAMPGDLGCNWSGAIFISHGWDGGCAFSTGFDITCNAGRITHFQWIEGCTRSR